MTVPVTGVDPAARFLIDRSWRLRPDSAETAFRLEATRGEIHLMRADRPLHPLQARVAGVAAPYLGVVDELAPGDTVRLVRDDEPPPAGVSGPHEASRSA
ncbi:hypothetical protein [Cellulomonas sp. Y8]|uniref:hypothetical protein n=1 Tax=Cellulomonas sp. Y8 TaxID=2591145 RepID=UPI003D70386D